MAIKSMKQTDVDEIQQVLNPLLGQTSWGVSLGLGSFITIEFGPPMPAKGNPKKLHGEWHLWLYGCAWRLEHQNRFLVGSEDNRDYITEALQHLENKALKTVDLFSPAWDSVFHFEDDLILRSFSTSLEEEEHWMLFTPNDKVLALGPGSHWSYQNSHHVEI